jgi:hypothetical protein
MYALIKDGQIVSTTGEPKKLFPNISFPAGGPTKDWLAGHNIFEVVDQPHKDQRFYWVTGTGLEVIDGVPTRTYTNTPKELEDITETVNGEEIVKEGLKTQWINIAKDTANKLLAATDWYVIRKAERGTDIPAEVVEKRALIVAQCNEKEAAITAATTVDELAQVI